MAQVVQPALSIVKRPFASLSVVERVVPVAAEHKLKIACHPNDPGMPNGKKWRGVVPVLGRVEGLKRFISIKENPYHGLNFCQGTICEGLENPNKEIHDIIRYFGQKKKIFISSQLIQKSGE